MQSVDYEKFVEAHLLKDRKVFVAPQYPIVACSHLRHVDILAIRPDKRRFYLVEVTENRNPGVLLDKIREYNQDAPSIADKLATELKLPAEKWSAKTLIFIRREAAPYFEAALKGLAYEQEYLEDLTQPKRAGSSTPNVKIWGRSVPIPKRGNGGEPVEEHH